MRHKEITSKETFAVENSRKGIVENATKIGMFQVFLSLDPFSVVS